MSTFAGHHKHFHQTEKTTLHRIPQRGSYDKEAVYQILDEAFICHIAFVLENNPFIVPTSYARLNDDVYIHGAAASRMLKSLQSGIEICMAVTLVDSLVLARSAFHHSMNYRSVIIFGQAITIEDTEQKMQALYVFSEHIIKNRWKEVRLPNAKELAATTVLKLPLQAVSAKIRTGPPMDDEEDINLPVWAGVIPLQITAGLPLPDHKLPLNTDVPDYVRNYSRPRSN